jgi:hypothetical protein
MEAVGYAGEDLQRVYVAAFGEIVGDMEPSHLGDVDDLKEALKRAIAFGKLLSKSKGEELVRLSRLIEKVSEVRVNEQP